MHDAVSKSIIPNHTQLRGFATVFLHSFPQFGLVSGDLEQMELRKNQAVHFEKLFRIKSDTR
ncbi:hypothetical protein A3843_08695 [Pseudovibrio exalbescens]|uniref:Uncharacterized protein n=1 Tax=Pseudovibrio exalbescens TaxID=197461 RepID=A0A1U7JI81_9HYPH|nr:hypothetical protein A3843_08695 [Pseudovibrio exalbescens]